MIGYIVVGLVCGVIGFVLGVVSLFSVFGAIARVVKQERTEAVKRPQNAADLLNDHSDLEQSRVSCGTCFSRSWTQNGASLPPGWTIDKQVGIMCSECTLEQMQDDADLVEIGYDEPGERD